MKSWERNNSTRHATTGCFTLHADLRDTKLIRLAYLYPDFAASSFESHGAYVEHILTRQQEIHDLVRRNTHQTQKRQKLKYDRHIGAKAYNSDWVFCRLYRERVRRI